MEIVKLEKTQTPWNSRLGNQNFLIFRPNLYCTKIYSYVKVNVKHSQQNFETITFLLYKTKCDYTLLIKTSEPNITNILNYFFFLLIFVIIEPTRVYGFFVFISIFSCIGIIK